VAQSSSAAHQIASRYAAALLDTAKDAGALDSVEKDMTDLSAMLEGSADLQKLVSSPAFAEAQQLSAIQAIADKAAFNKLTTNFLQVLVNNGRLNALKIILTAFREEVSRRRGDITAKVATAFPLTDVQTKELQAQLKQALGSNVLLDMKVDKSLLGGMVVTVGSRQLDDSVKAKLAQLKRSLTTTSNQNTKNLKEVG